MEGVLRLGIVWLKMHKSLPSNIKPHHLPNITYSQYILIYHILGVFNVRGGWGGFSITGRGLRRSAGLNVGFSERALVTLTLNPQPQTPTQNF